MVLASAFVAGVGIINAQPTLPPGPGADVIKARCVSCHDTDLISSQRLSAAGWTREIDKMVRWGAIVSVEQRDVLQSYLVANLGPRPAASHRTASPSTSQHLSAPPSTPQHLPAPPDPGDATFKRACLGCHGTDLVEQQRLTRAGWVREVDKMIRWGAAVSAAEKDPLVDHLSARFGPR